MQGSEWSKYLAPPEPKPTATYETILTDRQIAVLDALCEQDNQTVEEISDRIEGRPFHIHDILRDMVNQGWATRINGVGGHVYRYTVTGKGRRVAITPQPPDDGMTNWTKVRVTQSRLQPQTKPPKRHTPSEPLEHYLNTGTRRILLRELHLESGLCITYNPDGTPQESAESSRTTPKDGCTRHPLLEDPRLPDVIRLYCVELRNTEEVARLAHMRTTRVKDMLRAAGVAIRSKGFRRPMAAKAKEATP